MSRSPIWPIFVVKIFSSGCIGAETERRQVGDGGDGGHKVMEDRVTEVAAPGSRRLFSPSLQPLLSDKSAPQQMENQALLFSKVEIISV